MYTRRFKSIFTSFRIFIYCTDLRYAGNLNNEHLGYLRASRNKLLFLSFFVMY